MIQSPRQRYKLNKEASESFAQMSVHPTLLLAVDVALLQMLWETNSSDDSQKALAGYYKLSGAMDFVRTLLKLADPDISKSSAKSENLNWKT